MLTWTHERKRVVVGGVILQTESARRPALDDALLQGIARALHEHQLASSVH
jgi:hypothetical protein